MKMKLLMLAALLALSGPAQAEERAGFYMSLMCEINGYKSDNSLCAGFLQGVISG